MKEYKLNLSGNKDVIVHIPDDVELSDKDVFGLVGIEMQKAIAQGLTTVTKRIWPCLYCGNNYSSQQRLITHLDKHQDTKQRIEDYIKVKAAPQEKGVDTE